MRWLVDFKIALANLRATKMRTALTIIGIVIGVASVTTVFALGEGAKNMISGQVERMGPDMLTVRPGKAQRDSNGAVTGYNFLAALSASTLTERDLNTITATPGVAAAAPLMLVTGSISANDKPGRGTIVATTPQAADVLNLALQAGEFIDEQSPRGTVVLGDDLAIALLGSDSVIGQTVSLRGQTFTVSGILKRFGSSASVSNVFDLNQAAFIQLDDGKGFNQGIAQIQQINARARSDTPVETAAAALHKALLANHGNEEDFSVLNPEETLQLTGSVLQLMTTFTSAVASISIIVGGVGIMNIMLVSVTERTREIGIRKAVGAANSQILSQFLIEALVMSLIGGLGGILFGYMLAYAAGTLFLGFLPGVSWEIIGIALGVSLAVGMLFGAWPAIKAARKDPIEALRYFQ